MKMITLFLPEKYLEMFDTLVATGMYPNRSEALRMAAWKFLHESVRILKSISRAREGQIKDEPGLDELEEEELEDEDDDLSDLLEIAHPA
ncbi:MAG: ribbon-helix-helix domain-containing protein [Candidatus Hodarchaeota archaeon]